MNDTVTPVCQTNPGAINPLIAGDPESTAYNVVSVLTYLWDSPHQTHSTLSDRRTAMRNNGRELILLAMIDALTAECIGGES